MGVINVLDKHVAELIAAGEVVERPASVVKELLENSIDANANAITVEIQNGGTKYIRVQDNGKGILKDDIRVAFLRHATSKVRNEDDLLKIGTLGFRGEALASISSVSHVELITKSKDEELGTKYIVSGGEEEEFSDAGCPDGTTFIIRDIFFNVPARLKFLKSDVGEGNAIANVIDKLALSHPEIAFTFIRDGKTVLKTTGDNKLISAIYSVYGKDFASSLIPVEYELNGVKVSGFVSKPESSRPNRNMQNFFLNGRYVQSKTFMAAISEACKGYVMVGKFASCVINVTTSLEAVDVNVHPTKLEIRFVNERPIFDAIYHGIKSSFLKNEAPLQFKNNEKVVSPFDMAKKIFRERDNDVKQNSFTSFSDKVNDSKTNPLEIYSKQSIINENREKNRESTFIKKEVVEERKPLIKETPKIDIVKEKEEFSFIDDEEITVNYIGEAFSTYIIVEDNDELLFIDKHAAHERIIFEKLKKEKCSGYSQLLLTPISITLSKEEYNAVLSNLDVFKDASFDIEDFGSGTVLVRSAPQYLDLDDIESSVIEMAGYLLSNVNGQVSEKMEWIYHNVSCRAAIKAGNRSTKEELIDLAKKVLSDKNLRHCPHGRPVCISISKREIEKNFGRV